jgi:hypothetical protein
MAKDRIEALALLLIKLFTLANGLTRCLLPPIHSEYGEDPKDWD